MNEGRLGAPIGRRPVAQGWRVFLWLAAAFNFVLGALGMFSPQADVDARLIGLFVFAFGIVFVQAARDPERLAPVLWAGVIAKIGAVALLAPQAFGEGGTMLLAGGIGLDALFATGLLAFLLSRGGDL
ncbi:MAG: hypothetical protein V2I39_14980 [Erythrobacter sp.]|jgi:hypothetical protein|nr:hypothetical protein [Erythrobacter sp.]